MASIDKLAIRGIRSFSPDGDDQIIEFYLPLTIIVGANGCGKTTIIEALKYAVTGSLPPGNKSGQAFVHDPKHSKSSVVKANVKLRFTNIAKKSMLVVRSMEVSQKKSTMTFKSLDGVIRTTDENGNRVSMSHTCTELDRQIPQMLGVSKAVLEHVVFCHQEESSWPLQEGSVLKTRFDAIFDSTKYAKALEAIKETKKRYMNKVKDQKAELNLLQGHKHAAMGFRQEMDQAKQNLSDIADEIQKLNDNIQSERNRLAELQKVQEEYDEFALAIDAKSDEISKEKVRVETLRKALSKDLTKYSRDHLNGLLQGCQKSLLDDRLQLDQDEKRLNAIKKEIVLLQQSQVDLTQKKGMLLGEKSNYEKDLKRRIQLIDEIADRFRLEIDLSQQGSVVDRDSHDEDSPHAGLGLGTQQSISMYRHQSQGSPNTTGRLSALTQDTTPTNWMLTEEDMNAYRKAIQMKLEDLESSFSDLKRRNQREEDELQSQLGEHQAKIKSIEMDLLRFQGDREKAMEELQLISRNTFSSARIRKSDIEDARHQSEKFAKQRDDLNNNTRRTAIPLEIKDAVEKIERLRRSIEEDNFSLKELRRCAEEQNAIDILQRQIAQDIEGLVEFKNENSFLRQKHRLMPNISDNASNDILMNTTAELLQDVTLKFENSKLELGDTSEKTRSLENRLSKANALFNHNKQTLVDKREQLDALLNEGRGVQKIKQITKAIRSFEVSQGYEDILSNDVEPQAILDHLAELISQSNTSDDNPDSVSRTIKKLKRLSKVKDERGIATNIICPCCQREMNPDEAVVFDQRMDSLANPDTSALIKIDKARSDQYKAALKNFERWRANVSQSINDWLDHKRLTIEVASLEQSITYNEKELEELKKELSVLKDKESLLRHGNHELQELMAFARRFRDDAAKIVDKRIQVSSKQAQLAIIAPSANGRDLRTLENEVATKIESKDSLSVVVTSLNKELSDLNDQVSRLSNQAAQAEYLLKEKEEKFAKEQESTVRKQQLNEVIMNCQEAEKKLNEEINPFRQKARMKETERARLRASIASEENKFTDAIHNFKNACRKVDELSDEIDRFHRSNKLRLLEELESKIANLSSEIKMNETLINNMEPNIQALKSRTNDQEGLRKNVESNIALLDMIDVQKTLEDDLVLLEDRKNQFVQIGLIRKDLEEASRKIRSYTSEKDRREGNSESVRNQMRDLKRKLQSPEYDDIEERHRVKMIENEVNAIAVSDLEKYYNALDKALLRYHGMKISDINRIIQELWSLTYKGEDITSIRITSDQEDGSKASRSYNYRVVMTKGDTELDMRGRCSAGQRVLASIVIRLALAETFCLACGVMALDEPTTNLDHANKRGLAAAIAQIIKARSSQSNFQLVIITHDEDFVGMLKEEMATHAGLSMPEKYFHVSREIASDNCFYSKIHTYDWADL